METWFVILVSIVLATIIKSLRRDRKKLPRGPSFFRSHLLLLTNPLPELQSVIKRLKSKYGPLITISIGTHPYIFVGDHSLSHKLLIQKGATVSDRPKTWRLLGISSASYGPTWRLCRHNLASNFLHPSNIKSYSWAHKRVLGGMIDQLQEQQEAMGTVKVMDYIQLAMLRLLLFMCFGEKVDDQCVNEISRLQDGLLSFSGSLGFSVFLVSRLLAKILFRTVGAASTVS